MKENILTKKEELIYQLIIEEAHHEAHLCYATVEVHDWIDWFEKQLHQKDKFEIKILKIESITADGINIEVQYKNKVYKGKVKK